MKNEIDQIEKERNNLKQILEEKYKKMKQLKEKLNKYVEKMNKIQKEINARQFAMMDRSISYEKGDMDINFSSEEENNNQIKSTFQKQ